MNDYPISTLRGLMAASQHNRKSDILMDAQVSAVAVLNGLDAGFNKGKQKFLKKFCDRILKSMLNKTRKKKTEKSGDQESLLKAFGLKAPTDG
jgi:hypothetical protein